ncbi:MAG: aminoglycoside phosphotransferase [Gammaproteobacteria bacterium]|nr:MAG: aminoglycoside phosphotransferase [Gammaproteobacteria bacterium]
MYKELFVTDDLENISEEIVFEELSKIIDDGELEFSETAITVQDIVAIALNKMPPKYICSFVEKKYPRETLRLEIMEMKKLAHIELIKAIEKVNANPHE